MLLPLFWFLCFFLRCRFVYIPPSSRGEFGVRTSVDAVLVIHCKPSRSPSTLQGPCAPSFFSLFLSRLSTLPTRGISRVHLHMKQNALLAVPKSRMRVRSPMHCRRSLLLCRPDSSAPLPLDSSGAKSPLRPHTIPNQKYRKRASRTSSLP